MFAECTVTPPLGQISPFLDFPVCSTTKPGRDGEGAFPRVGSGVPVGPSFSAHLTYLALQWLRPQPALRDTARLKRGRAWQVRVQEACDTCHYQYPCVITLSLLKKDAAPFGCPDPLGERGHRCKPCTCSEVGW